MEITRPVISIDSNKNHYIIHVNSKYHFTMHMSTVLYRIHNVKKMKLFGFIMEVSEARNTINSHRTALKF